MITLNNKNVEDAFKQEFGQDLKKPLGLGEKIWSLTEDRFKKINFNKGDLKLIKNIMIWCLKNAGADITEFDLKNEFLNELLEQAKKNPNLTQITDDLFKKARNLGMTEDELKEAYRKLLEVKFNK